MENRNERHLTFPQKNWLLLCILTAIASALAVSWIHNGAQKKLYNQSVEVRRDTSGRDTGNQLKSPPSTGGAAVNAATGNAGKDSGSKSNSPADSSKGGGKKIPDSTKQ